MKSLDQLKNQFSETLTRSELKRTIGGAVEAGCVYISSTNGYSSCWYVSNSENAETLCQRVYGSKCNPVGFGPMDCEDYCIMN